MNKLLLILALVFLFLSIYFFFIEINLLGGSISIILCIIFNLLFAVFSNTKGK